MRRPAYITLCAILLLGSALLEPLRSPAPRFDQSHLVGLSFNLAIFLVVSFCLWKGQNWARWTAFLLCAFCFLEFRSLYTPQPIGKTISTVYDAGIAVFLFVYLNTRSIRDWYTGRSKAPPSSTTCNSRPSGVVSSSE